MIYQIGLNTKIKMLNYNKKLQKKPMLKDYHCLKVNKLSISNNLMVLGFIIIFRVISSLVIKKLYSTICENITNLKVTIPLKFCHWLFISIRVFKIQNLRNLKNTSNKFNQQKINKITLKMFGL